MFIFTLIGKNMLLRVLPTRLWQVWLLLIAGLGLSFYLVLGRGSKSSVTVQQLSRQKIIARAEASNIMSFFQVFGESIAILARSSGIEQWDTETVQDMDAFVEQWRDSGLVKGVVLTDRNGVVQFNSNVLGTPDIGMSLADRDYFAWAKKQTGEGEYFIGQPVVSRLGATKGEVIVPLASPVYQKGVFTGVVTAPVELKPLTERYLGLMKVSEMTDVYLLGQQGNLLYSNSATDAVGSNVFEAQGHPFLGNQTLNDNLKDALSTTKEGALRASYLNPQSGKSESRLIAYSPILLGSQNWLLVMATPIQVVTNLAKPIYIRQIAILLLVSLTLLLFGIIVSRENQKGLEQPTSQKRLWK